MRTKRTIVERMSGLVYFKHNGKGTVYCMTDEQWAIELVKDNLIDAGADEKLVEQLYSMTYSYAYDEARKDAESEDF